MKTIPGFVLTFSIVFISSLAFLPAVCAGPELFKIIAGAAGI